MSRTWMKIGPFRIIPGFEFRNFGWVSNIYGRTSAEETLSDFLITPSAKVDVYFILMRSLILSFTENPEYHIYLKNPRYNRLNNNYGAELSFPFLGPLVITGGFDSRRYRHLPLPEVDRQVEAETRRIRVEIAYETPRRLSWTLNGFAQELGYVDILEDSGEEDALSRSLNRQEVGGRLEVRYEAFRGSRLFLQLGYVRHNFLYDEAGWKDAETRSFLAGIRFPQQGVLSGSLALGFKRFQPSDRSLPRFSGMIAQTQVGIRLGTDSSLSLGYNRDTSFSYWANTLYYLSDSFNASYSMSLTRYLDIRLSGFYTLFNYPNTAEEGATEDTGPPPGWGDRYGGFSAGFTVPVWKSIRAGLTYQYWTRPSGFLGSGDGHLVTINFVRK
ncbi:MAG: outer membrane beta-barrel protein [Candidatus Aminicenantes bacterium]|nr:outer membrane beta-barrel protein [Candidatus Aminicenantes bacterium]